MEANDKRFTHHYYYRNILFKGFNMVLFSLHVSGLYSKLITNINFNFNFNIKNYNNNMSELGNKLELLHLATIIGLQYFMVLNLCTLFASF